MSPTLKKTLTRLVDVRREELGRVLPLTAAFALFMASLYVLKPARNALFLNRFGVGQLPYVLLLVALVGGVAAGINTRFARSVRLDRMILGTFLVLMANLLIFRAILPRGGPWAVYAFYVWVNLYGLTAASLLWLLTNSTFNPREARRLFGLIGTGSIVGVILGGLFTRQVVETVGTENLLLVCVGLLGVCLLLVRRVRPGAGASHREEEASDGVLASIARFDLLRLLGITAGLAAVVATVADVQFNDIANRAFPTKDAKTAFFGEFFACLNAFVFLFQLLLTPRILRSLGVGAALLFLPLSLALGSLSVLLIPGLWGGILVKVGDGGFRHSIHKSAAEILFLPVPPGVKQRTKMFMDVTVDNLASGLGALLVLLLTGPLGVAYRHLSLLSLGAIAVWVVLTFRVRRAYVDAFRKAIERRDIDLNDLRMNISEASNVEALRTALGSPNERQVVYALDMLASAKGPKLAPLIRPLLKHPSPAVRRSAVRALQVHGDETLAPDVEALIQDEDPEVRMEAIQFLCRMRGGDPLKRMKGYLEHPDFRVQSAAVGCVAAFGAPEEKALIDERMIRALLSRPEEIRAQIARVLGALNRPDLRGYLWQVTEDPSSSVVRQAIESVGQIRDREFVPWLLTRLSDKRYRSDARRALVAFGPPILNTLNDALTDETADLSLRRSIPRVLSEIPVQQSVDLLMASLERASLPLKHPLIKALNKLRARHPALRFDGGKVDALLIEETRSYCEILQILHAHREARDGAAARLLRKALAEKRDQNLERIFRLLGLRYPPRDIFNAYRGVVSENPAAHANAVEFLDNVLDRDKKRYLFPFLEQVPTE
ncbi:MAG: hypothetical protein A3F84_05145, partial [Candidatus Handelsmanbacteria bacterium RIFCSPLOWO2_12_FULL_64_10]